MGDLQNTDPQLDPQRLQNNGGPTQTIALQASSPAIDRIPAANCPATDQRGFTRPDDAADSACDIGAYESNYDDDLGLTNLPATITADATSPQGATVTYTPPTATASVSCNPASGATFAIGTTTVTCKATDSDDTNSPVSGSFQVVVKGAAAQVSDQISTVNSFGLPADLQAGFDTQLQAVQSDLTNHNTTQACSDLTAFINHVEAQSGKYLTVSQANQLIAAAKQVQAVLGCSPGPSRQRTILFVLPSGDHVKPGAGYETPGLTGPAELAAIPALIQEGDAVILDQHVHNSVQMAVELVRSYVAHVEVVRHSNMQALDKRLADLTTQYNCVWYLADGVYSMFGDLVPIEELKELLRIQERACGGSLRYLPRSCTAA